RQGGDRDEENGAPLRPGTRASEKGSRFRPRCHRRGRRAEVEAVVGTRVRFSGGPRTCPLNVPWYLRAPTGLVKRQRNGADRRFVCKQTHRASGRHLDKPAPQILNQPGNRPKDTPGQDDWKSVAAYFQSRGNRRGSA